ncbi:MAG: NADH-quinone oxidoreductase subunit J [Candidatus Bathyarchaeia archaeon]
MIDLLEIFLIIVVVVLAVLTVELKNLLHAVICLSGMCIVIGTLYGTLNAPYVMVFQILIYAGAAMVFFLSVIMLTSRDRE